VFWMAVSVLLSTALASDLLRTATESLLNRFCLTLPTYFRRLVALFPQHASEDDRVNTTTRGFQEYQMLFRQDGQAQLFASAEEEPAVAQCRAISFSLGLGCLRYCRRVWFHLYGYVLEKEPAKFASPYLIYLLLTSSELLSFFSRTPQPTPSLTIGSPSAPIGLSWPSLKFDVGRTSLFRFREPCWRCYR